MDKEVNKFWNRLFFCRNKQNSFYTFMTMIVVALSHYVQLWSINVNLMVMEATVEFLWWMVCKVIFVSNPKTVLRLCCVLLMLGLWQYDLILLGTQWIFVALKCSLLLYIPDYLSGNIKSLNVKYLVVM